MRMNIIPVFDKDFKHVLMCKRANDPFKGMYNFVGGKVEGDESEIEAAYRELQEETGIAPDDIELIHFMNMYFALKDRELVVFVGKLNQSINLVEEKNQLFWLPINENFFDLAKYAGNGNVGFIIEEIKRHKDNLFL